MALRLILNRYLINVTVGGQLFQVILDTGSSDLWITNSNFSCVDANRTVVPPETCQFGPAKFNSSASTTFEPASPNATFFVQYGSGEFLRGPVGFDTVEIAGVSVTQQKFGIPDLNHFLGDEVPEGVLGLAYPGLTSVYTVAENGSLTQSPYMPFFFNAVEQNQITEPSFSISLDRASLEQEENDLFDPKLGFFAFGTSVPVPVLNTSVTVPIQGYGDGFIPSNASDARFFWYTIDIDSYIFPGSEALVTKSNKTILDTGAPTNEVPSRVAAAFNALFIPPATLNENSRYVVECNATAPTFTVVIGGKEFTVDPRDQIIAGKDADGNKVCYSGTQDGGPDVPGNNFILGNVFLHNVVTTFNPIDRTITLTQRAPY
ncbi:acid protease, partial [Favolaschia claudopus]